MKDMINKDRNVGAVTEDGSRAAEEIDLQSESLETNNKPLDITTDSFSDLSFSFDYQQNQLIEQARQEQAHTESAPLTPSQSPEEDVIGAVVGRTAARELEIVDRTFEQIQQGQIPTIAPELREKTEAVAEARIKSDQGPDFDVEALKKDSETFIANTSIEELTSEIETDIIADQTVHSVREAALKLQNDISHIQEHGTLPEDPSPLLNEAAVLSLAQEAGLSEKEAREFINDERLVESGSTEEIIAEISKPLQS